MQCGEETGCEGQRSDPDTVCPVVLKRHIAERVDLLVQLEPAIVIEYRSYRVARNHADGATDTADNHPLKHENPLDLLAARAHGNENCNVAVFFHHEHYENDKNVQCGDKLNQTHGDNAHHLLEPQCVQ